MMQKDNSHTGSGAGNIVAIVGKKNTIYNEHPVHIQKMTNTFRKRDGDGVFYS